MKKHGFVFAIIFSTLLFNFPFSTSCAENIHLKNKRGESSSDSQESGDTPPKKRPRVDAKAQREDLDAKKEESELKEQCSTCFGKSGCREGRVYRTSLNYDLKIDNVEGHQKMIDEWHTAKQGELKEILNQVKDKVLNKNLVLAGLSLAYKVNGNIEFSKIYDIPIIFSSGSFANLDPINKLPVKTVSDFFPELSGEPNKLQGELKHKMKNHLQGLFGNYEARPSHMDSSLEPRQKEINETSKPGFVQGYYHSEQALLLYLTSEIDQWLSTPFNDLPQNAIIHLLNINIVSDRQMCLRCGATCFRWAENATGFEDLLKKKISQKGGQFSQDKVYLLVEVSGLRVFQLPEKLTLNQQLSHADETVEATTVSPHVVQKTINTPQGGQGSEKGGENDK